MSERTSENKVEAALRLKAGDGREEAIAELTVSEKELALEALILDGLLVAMSQNPKASLITESRRFIEEARRRRQQSVYGATSDGSAVADDDSATSELGCEDFPSFDD